MRLLLATFLFALSYAQTGCPWVEIGTGVRCEGSTVNTNVNSPGECQALAEAADRHFFTYRLDRNPPQCRVPNGSDDAEVTLNCLTSPRVPGSGEWAIYQQICPDPTNEPTISPSFHPTMEPTMKAPTSDPTTIE